MFILFFFFIAITTSEVIHAMENQPTNETKKKSSSAPSLFNSLKPKKRSRKAASLSDSRNQSIIKKSSPPIDIENTIKPIVTPLIINLKESDLTIAIRNKNICELNKFLIIKQLLSDPFCDPNYQNIFGMTALHYTAMNKNFDIVNCLVSDFRVDSTIANKKNLLASALVTVENDQDIQAIKLRRLLFAKVTLDTATNTESLNVFFGISSVQNAIRAIKKKFDLDKKAQQKKEFAQKSDDRELPQETGLPPYATDEFIEKMILYKNNNRSNEEIIRFYTLLNK